MKSLGIAGRRHHAAAALCIDGRIVAAVAEHACATPNVVEQDAAGVPAAAVRLCLARGGVTACDIDELVVVRDCGDRAYSRDGDAVVAAFEDLEDLDGFCDRQIRMLEPAVADAAQATAGRRDELSLVMVIGLEPGSAGTFVAGTRLEPIDCRGSSDQLWCGLQRVGRQLGCSSMNLVQELDSLACAGEPEYAAAFHGVIRPRPNGPLLDETALRAVISAIAAQSGTALADADPRNVSAQTQRRDIAASVVARLGEVLAEAAAEPARSVGARHIGFGGELFSMMSLCGQIRRSLGSSTYFSPVPERVGRALGAALAPAATDTKPFETLALGPEFTDSEIKAVLDNCRLDYVYEPDWSRLLVRISKLLADGKTIAWFQGPMEFGSRALGQRSILCDPSNRYARDNITMYLRQAGSEESLVVSMLEAAAADCLEAPVIAPFVPSEAIVRPRWRDPLRAAVDHRYRIVVHTASAGASAFAELLRVHRERTGVPGIVNCPLTSSPGRIACTPRDAVRAAYSSATDALVIGRFLMMKDYWLLRHDWAA